MEYLSNFPIYAWISIIVIVALIGFVILRICKVNVFTLKLGDKEMRINQKEQASVIQIVTDYADFKYKLNNELTEAKRDLKEKARWITDVHVSQGINRITSDYIQVLRDSKGSRNNDDYITISIFPLIAESLKARAYKFMIDVFEQNHLANKDDNELHDLAHVNYGRLKDIFKDFIQTRWCEFMAPLEELYTVGKEDESFLEELVYSVLVMYSNYSKQRNELCNIITDIDTSVRGTVQKTGKLPVNYLSIIDNFYIPGTGINSEYIKNYLNLISLE